jgi:predicted RNase H-like HicB family nuclease
MKTRKVIAVIERASDGTYSIYMDADDMDYLVTGTGKTVDEAMRMFKGGYEDMRRYYEENGKNFEEANFDFKYDMASFLAYYSKVLSLAGLSRLTGINQQQLSHYVTGRRRPSAKTVEKMQDAIQHFGNDLSSVRFV